MEEVRRLRRKGALTAMPDAALLKAVYEFGLRRGEAVHLDEADLRSNPKIREYGRAGAVFVRYGMSSRGGPPKRRTVLTLPGMDWVGEVIEQYLSEIRPLFTPGKHPAVWVTERVGRLCGSDGARRLAVAAGQRG